jgi:hypothetical protein
MPLALREATSCFRKHERSADDKRRDFDATAELEDNARPVLLTPGLPWVPKSLVHATKPRHSAAYSVWQMPEAARGDLTMALQPVFRLSATSLVLLAQSRSWQLADGALHAKTGGYRAHGLSTQVGFVCVQYSEA